MVDDRHPQTGRNRQQSSNRIVGTRVWKTGRHGDPPQIRGELDSVVKAIHGIIHPSRFQKILRWEPQVDSCDLKLATTRRRKEIPSPGPIEIPRTGSELQSRQLHPTNRERCRSLQTKTWITRQRRQRDRDRWSGIEAISHDCHSTTSHHFRPCEVVPFGHGCATTTPNRDHRGAPRLRHAAPGGRRWRSRLQLPGTHTSRTSS